MKNQELCIRLTTLVSIALFMLISCDSKSDVSDINDGGIKRVGEFGGMFDDIDKILVLSYPSDISDEGAIKRVGYLSKEFDHIEQMWSFDRDFIKNQEKRHIEEYIILEYGGIGWGKDYNYVLIDLKTEVMESKINKFNVNTKSSQYVIKQRDIKNSEISKLKDKTQGLSSKNNIYDGSDYVVKDGGIYIVRYYYKGKLKNKFGLRDLSDFIDEGNELKQERQLNLEIIRAIFDLVKQQEDRGL